MTMNVFPVDCCQDARDSHNVLYIYKQQKGIQQYYAQKVNFIWSKNRRMMR